MSFYFVGQGPFSKSLLLRALITQSYFPELKIEGTSSCLDVLSIQKSLAAFANKESYFFGLEGGAVLRFLALRLARAKGEFTLQGSRRLFERPMQELETILNQLSCSTQLTETSLTLKSGGWHPSGDALTLSAHRSSQFSSAVFLNSWQLDQDLFVGIEGHEVSTSYFEMTLSFLTSLGMKILGDKKEYFIPARQEINKFTYQPESDMSCLFSLAAMTVTEGEACFTNWPKKSLQPDYIFPSLLEEMGFQVKQNSQTLKIKGGVSLKPIKASLKNSPDLFPVLASLCALAQGKSQLYETPQLLYKESNRIKETARLLEQTGHTVEVLKDGLIIEGKTISSSDKSQAPIQFDPKGDHRIAFAAAVLKKAGYPIRILHPDVVDKSFPNFWSLLDEDL